MNEKPSVTGTTHILPFGQLSSEDFERLSLWLIEAEGYVRAEQYGLSGSDSGRDIVAYKTSDGTEERWIFQAKRRQRVPASEFIRDLEKVSAAGMARPERRAAGVIFLISSPVPASVRDAVTRRAAELNLRVEIWASTELDLRVKQHYRIVCDFFQLPSERLIRPAELRDEVSHLLYSRMKMRRADLEHIAVFHTLGPMLDKLEIHDETTVALIWNLLHHVSITYKHSLWKRRALDPLPEFRISDLAPFSGTTELWFKDPAYLQTEHLAGSMAQDIAKRTPGLQASKRGFVRRIFIDRKRSCLDNDGRLFLRLLKRQSKAKVELYVVLSDDLPHAMRSEPYEITVVGRDLATTFEHNSFTHYIVPLDRADEIVDQYSEVERFAIPAAEYIQYLSSLSEESSR